MTIWSNGPHNSFLTSSADPYIIDYPTSKHRYQIRIYGGPEVLAQFDTLEAAKVAYLILASTGT